MIAVGPRGGKIIKYTGQATSTGSQKAEYLGNKGDSGYEAKHSKERYDYDLARSVAANYAEIAKDPGVNNIPMARAAYWKASADEHGNNLAAQHHQKRAETATDATARKNHHDLAIEYQRKASDAREKRQDLYEKFGDDLGK